MGKIYTGDFEFNASFDVNASKPFDTRFVVDNVSTIDYPYKGLLVYETNSQGSKYKYFDGTEWKTLFDAQNGQVPIEQLPTGNNEGDVVVLGEDGKISSDFLPSYVDDVIEGYYDEENDTFYSSYVEDVYSDEITGETSKIYVDLDTNNVFRWSGHQYIKINETNELVLTDDIVPSVSVGGVSAGVANTISAGTSLEDVLRLILSPTLYPTFVAPSATMTIYNTSADASHRASLLLECGSTNSVNFTINFNRGSITPAYGTSGYRAGTATSYQLNDGTTQNENSFSNVSVTQSSEGTSTYTGTVNYSAGEQPKNSVGGNYSSALPAGSVSANVTFEFVNRIWTNKNLNTNIVAMENLVSLQGSAGTRSIEITFSSSTPSNPYTFDFPQTWLPNGRNSITSIKMKNVVSGEYDAGDINNSTFFNVANNITHNNAGGASVAYYRFTYAQQVDVASNTFKIVW